MGALCYGVCALAGLHMSQSHDYSLVMPAYTSGQPSSVSDAVTVADMSSAVIGLSVTVALVIVISVTIVIVSLVVIIVLCHRQGTYGDNDHDPLYVCHQSMSLCHDSLHAASYKVKGPPPKTDDYQMEDIKEVKLESNPAYEAVTTT